MAYAQDRKPLHPLIAALLVGVFCVLSHVPILWLLDNQYADPARVFANEFNLSAFNEWDPLWVFSLLGAGTVFCFLVAANGTPSRSRRLASQVGAAICFAASTLNFVFAAEDLNWLKIPSGFPFGEHFIVELGMAALVCLLVWILITRRWSDADVFKYGLRYSTNIAMAVMVFSVPANAVAAGYSGFLSGLGTFISIYFSIQVLIVTGSCGLWLRRYTPGPLAETPIMHAARARLALRESVLFGSAAFLIFVMSYSMYSFASQERFKLALLGQIGFCVLGICSVARGISGYLLRESRPFWLLGLYLLLADLIVVVAWRLIYPSVL